MSLRVLDIDTCESSKLFAGVSLLVCNTVYHYPIWSGSGCDDMQPTLQQNKTLTLDYKPLNLLPWQQRWSLSCIKAEASDTCSAKAKYKHTLTGGSRTAPRGRWGQQLLGYLYNKVLRSDRKTWERFPVFTWCPWARLLRLGLTLSECDWISVEDGFVKCNSDSSSPTLLILVVPF